jgi:xanthine dehydrogenase iron-sulfur cluster and FAD-binding subunit A
VVVALTYLVRQGRLSRDDVVEALEAHHCRCTGYYAILRAAESLLAGGP